MTSGTVHRSSLPNKVVATTARRLRPHPVLPDPAHGGCQNVYPDRSGPRDGATDSRSGGGPSTDPGRRGDTQQPYSRRGGQRLCPNLLLLEHHAPSRLQGDLRRTRHVPRDPRRRGGVWHLGGDCRPFPRPSPLRFRIPCRPTLLWCVIGVMSQRRFHPRR